MNIKPNRLIYDFFILVCELEKAKTPDDVRNVLKDVYYKAIYQKIVDNGGFEAISWCGKQIIKMKEKQSEQN